MKTAISLSDSLFKHADITAKKLGISRSSLFARALKEYLEDHNPIEVTKKLDQIYADSSNSLDPIIYQMQSDSISKENW
jgi:metal-responsive CopG/Arc/MetJ family transcriptional regulator